MGRSKYKYLNVPIYHKYFYAPLDMIDQGLNWSLTLKLIGF